MNKKGSKKEKGNPSNQKSDIMLLNMNLSNNFFWGFKISNF